MPLEVKTVEVIPQEEQLMLDVMYTFGWRLANSQRVEWHSSTPDFAVTYEHMTYIHSRSESDRYTNMTFERNTNLIGYDELVELEEEFWELVPYRTERRPLPPPPMMDFKTWAKSVKPKTVSGGMKFLFGLISFFVFALILLPLICEAAGAPTPVLQLLKDDWEQVLAVFLYGVCPVAFVLAVIASIILGRIYSAVTLNNPATEGGAYARMLYEEYQENHRQNKNAVEMFDYAVVRIPQIFVEARQWLNMNG